MDWEPIPACPKQPILFSFKLLNVKIAGSFVQEAPISKKNMVNNRNTGILIFDC